MANSSNFSRTPPGKLYMFFLGCIPNFSFSLAEVYFISLFSFSLHFYFKNCSLMTHPCSCGTRRNRTQGSGMRQKADPDLGAAFSLARWALVLLPLGPGEQQVGRRCAGSGCMDSHGGIWSSPLPPFYLSPLELALRYHSPSPTLKLLLQTAKCIPSGFAESGTSLHWVNADGCSLIKVL